MSGAPSIRMINTHAEGELGYVAIEGVPDIPGASLAERLAWLNSDSGTPLRGGVFLYPADARNGYESDGDRRVSRRVSVQGQGIQGRGIAES